MSGIEIQPAEEFGIQQDSFERFWTPHRMMYIKQETPRGKDGQTCPFCSAVDKSDEEGLVFWRGEKVYALMNLFPYGSGHILICPKRHISLYEEMTTDERRELADATDLILRALRRAFNPDGMNLGFNQGEVAGAGIAAHLHQHIVPRWRGDSNFFPIIAGVKAVPQLLGEQRAKLSSAVREVEAEDAAAEGNN